MRGIQPGGPCKDKGGCRQSSAGSKSRIMAAATADPGGDQCRCEEVAGLRFRSVTQEVGQVVAAEPGHSTR